MVMDFAAVGVLLLVECLLFSFGDMAVVLRSHIALFLAHLVVIAL